MRTENLVDLLAEDASPPWGLRAGVSTAVVAGIALATILFLADIGARSDIGSALRTVRFPFKFVATIALAVTATRAAAGLGRPDARPGWHAVALGLAPALVACAVAVELSVLPESRWLPSLVGHNARSCLALIPLLALGPLACLLAALRQGAPSRPGLAGAVAGLAAGGIAATLYAAHCDDDSPLFLALWYPLAILIVSEDLNELIGLAHLSGRRLLAW